LIPEIIESFLNFPRFSGIVWHLYSRNIFEDFGKKSKVHDNLQSFNDFWNVFDHSAVQIRQKSLENRLAIMDL
jgi:hypothetical protein